MSNLRINIRFLQYHLQITDNWKWSLIYNQHHKQLNHGWFHIYEWSPLKKTIK